MKLVREYINEKFVEDSDPIQDMGIGIDAIISNCIENIFKKNSKDNFFFDKIPVVSITQGSIREIIVEPHNLKFKIKFFSDNYRDSKGEIINKEIYIKKLLESIGMMCMLNKKCSHKYYNSQKNPYEFTFIIKKQYKRYFNYIEGRHQNPYR